MSDPAGNGWLCLAWPSCQPRRLGSGPGVAATRQTVPLAIGILMTYYNPAQHLFGSTTECPYRPDTVLRIAVGPAIWVYFCPGLPFDHRMLLVEETPALVKNERCHLVLSLGVPFREPSTDTSKQMLIERINQPGGLQTAALATNTSGPGHRPHPCHICGGI